MVTFRNQPNETLSTGTASVACPKTDPPSTGKALGGYGETSHPQTASCREVPGRC